MKKRDIIIDLVMVVVGFILLICNLTRTAPGLETTLDSFITTCIAYGFLLGPVFIMIGVGSLVYESRK